MSPPSPTDCFYIGDPNPKAFAFVRPNVRRTLLLLEFTDPSRMNPSPPHSDEPQVPPVSRELPQAAACNVTLPNFWLEDPQLWFIQGEAKFRMHKIVAQNRKYDLLVDALPPQAAREVRNRVIAPHPEMPYDKLKEALISRMVASEQKRLQQHLSIQQLRDRRPSQLLRHLQHLLGDKTAALDTAILRELFLERLPTTVRVWLAPSHSLPLTELAELADKIMEATSLATVNASHQTPQPTTTELSSVLAAIAELRSSVCELSLQVGEIRRCPRSSSPRQRSVTPSRSSRSNSPRRSSGDFNQLCFYQSTVSLIPFKPLDRPIVVSAVLVPKNSKSPEPSLTIC